MKALREYVNLRDEGLPFNIWINESSCSRLELPYSRWHEFSEIICITEGCIVQKINGKSCRMEEGDLAFINGLDFHSYYLYPNSSAKFLVIQLPPSFISLLYRKPRNYKITSNFFKNDSTNAISNEIQSCIKDIMVEFTDRQNAYGYYLTSHVYRLLGAIFRNSEVTDCNDREFAEQKLLLERISPALDYIYGNFKREISLKELSSLVGICGQHFCKCFKKATARTFTQYLNELRILHAQDLLLTTDMNITEVAYSSGFSSPNYFNKIFKRLAGTTPFDFRRR